MYLGRLCLVGGGEVKRFYPILLVLSIFLTTLGQISDNNEFEAKVVRVFEWVLDGRFSAAQRAELSTLIESARRSRDPSDLKSFQDVAKLNDHIDSIPPERQAETHAAIQSKVLEQLRKQPNDPTARLLLSVYNNGRSTTQPATSSVSSTSRQGSENVRSSVPSELIG